MMDERGEPTDAQLLDWAEHNDHTDGLPVPDVALDTIDVLDHIRRTLEYGLCAALAAIEHYDISNYKRRNQYVIAALNYATQLGYRSGVGFDPVETEWPIVYIELPGAGQVSWHLPGYDKPWDGHETSEKYRRVREYLNVRGDGVFWS